MSGPTFRRERELLRSGCTLIAGVDEAGRGAWAGPVVGAAVILPISRRTLQVLRGVDDSKRLTAAEREAMRARIQRVAIAWAVGCASNAEIDALGILAATRLAMMRAVAALSVAPDALLIDAITLPECPLDQHAFNYADAISLSVAAASIMAKTSRDALMCALDRVVHGYGFARHKGYGTAVHAAALSALGPCWAHRRTFKPVSEVASNE